MRLKLQNIGIIEEASIDINGITIIAGQNDSGKSTVGKVLYALIRGVNEDETTHNINKHQFVLKTLRDIENLIYRNNTSNEKDKKIIEKFEKEFTNVFNSRSLLFGKKNDLETYTTISEELEKVKQLFHEYSVESFKIKLFETIENFSNRIYITYNSIEAIQYRVKAFFNNEFNSQIKYKFKKDGIKPSEIEIQNKKIFFKKELELEGFEDSTFYFSDVTFIESPLMLKEKFYGRLISTPTNKNEYLNWKVFNKPEDQLDIFTDNSEKINSFIEDITEIIKGNFTFDEFHNLLFNKSGVDFDLGNVATGIKTFGILQVLLKKGDLNSNTLLIIDEPEVHLHPLWQVKFAEILVRLSKEFAISMVLTSHSPYFIEALEIYSKKHNYSDSTNFYFAEKSEDGLSSKIISVNDQLSKIYGSISDASFKIRKIEDELEQH